MIENMQKLDLADFILRHLYSSDESYYASDRALAIELNCQDGIELTDEQVEAALTYLHDRELIDSIVSFGGQLHHISLSIKGEDLVTAGYGVRDLARRNTNSYINNTTIQGDVEQFVQGDHNTVVQNKAATADELLEDVLRLLENHNETAAVKEAREAKQEGGIRAALKYLADKAFGGGFTYAGTVVTKQVIATLPQITQALS